MDVDRDVLRAVQPLNQRNHDKYVSSAATFVDANLAKTLLKYDF